MNRRDFIVRSSLLASAGLLARSSLFAETPAAAPAVPVKTPPKWTPEFRPLRRNVGLFIGRGGTIGWLSNPEALMIVDTQFLDSAAVCLAGLPGRGDRMIDVVMDTHHHADHTGGNGVFRPAARKIVAQANVPGLMRAAAEKAGTLDKQTYPDTTFPGSWSKDFGDEMVTATYYGPAHTNGDVIVNFERANVIHLGDLLFNRIYPVIDRPGGASIQGWIARLETVLNHYSPNAIYVCGHGNPKFGVTVGHPEVRLQRDYLSALLSHVEKGIAAGQSKAEIVALENFPGFEDLHEPKPNRLKGNLSVAYDELTEKKG